LNSIKDFKGFWGFGVLGFWGFGGEKVEETRKRKRKQEIRTKRRTEKSGNRKTGIQNRNQFYKLKIKD